MIFRGGRSIARLPQLSLQCAGNRRALFSPSNLERVPAFYSVLSSQYDSNNAPKTKLITPIVRRRYTDKPVSRPKAHTGRTAAAARKAPSTSATKAAKKPAAKKTTPKAIPKSKAKPRIKPKPKVRKKAKAKPKAKPKRKVLTDKQKTAREARKAKDEIKALKVKALLDVPKKLPASAWTVFQAERAKAQGGGAAKLGQIAKESSVAYKQLSPEQLEHYNHTANQNKAANENAYKQWIESHSPQVVHEANLARLNLKRRLVKKGGQTYSRLKDDRQVRGLTGAYNYFYAERQRSGDYKGLKANEAVKLAGREWRGLSTAEKKPYVDRGAQDKVRYDQERKTVYNL